MLDYLDFDTSDDGEGLTSLDAMAYAKAAQWPALTAEVTQLLAWCSDAFGAPGALEDGHRWDLDLQLQSDAGDALALHWDALQRQLLAPQAAQQTALQLSLTLSGPDAFAQQLTEQFLGSND
ncbi:hypothetical protein [Comamonas sp. JNW]|uniref:hypothetical protein n=1 Tax=Comamonas sp. JNW TaxID=2170731 RepID=UPI001057B777|nr:hypothetical protein [Comamonas sp. JNW]